MNGDWLALGAVGLLAAAGVATRRGSRGQAPVEAWYHGTEPQRARAILRAGVDLQAERRRDPGDFGWGFYLTREIERAECHGGAVLQVQLDPSRLARIDNPYFIAQGSFDPVTPSTDAQRLFHQIAFDLQDDFELGAGPRMRTVRGPLQQRIETSQAIRDAFLAAGYTGILASQIQGGEAVVFDPSAIRQIEEVKMPAAWEQWA